MVHHHLLDLNSNRCRLHSSRAYGARRRGTLTHVRWWLDPRLRSFMIAPPACPPCAADGAAGEQHRRGPQARAVPRHPVHRVGRLGDPGAGWQQLGHLRLGPRLSLGGA